MISNDKISIVIPVYNEGREVVRIVSEILDKYKGSEVIVVDDGSTDNASSMLEGFNIKFIRHERNRGYGASLKTGIKAAANDLIVTIDSDGEHSADDIKALIVNLESFDMAVGKRNKFPKDILWRLIGKDVLRFIADLAVGLKIPDINSGLRIFKKSVMEKYFDFFPDSFSFHTTSTLVYFLNDHKIKYFFINTNPRNRDSRVSLAAGIESLRKIFVLLLVFCPQRIFVVIGYPLSVLLILLFLIGGFLRPLLIAVFFTAVLIGMDLLSRCDKKLIVTSRGQD